MSKQQVDLRFTNSADELGQLNENIGFFEGLEEFLQAADEAMAKVTEKHGIQVKANIVFTVEREASA